MTLNGKISQWAIDKLLSLGYSLNNAQAETLLDTPWSLVIRFSTTDGDIYLKQTPDMFALEPTIIKTLGEQFHATVATVIAHNTELHCFLMKDAGKPLRAILKQKFDESLLLSAIEQFTSLQAAVSNRIDIFLDLGVPDYRLDKLPSLYQTLVSKKELLIDEGLSNSEISRLVLLTPKISNLCEKLSHYPIRQTIVQPDFNDNNILVDDRLESITLIDFGEIVISHPFFSLLNCLAQLQKHHGLSEQDSTYLLIQDVCFKNYMSYFHSQTSFLKFLDTAKRVKSVYELVYHHRFMLACGKEKLIKYQHWKLGDLLKKMITIDI